jgi:hypothetical protein
MSRSRDAWRLQRLRGAGFGRRLAIGWAYGSGWSRRKMFASMITASAAKPASPDSAWRDRH